MVARKKRKRYREKVKEKVIKRDFFLTAQDQITYIYKKEKEEYLEVINVSYEIKVENKWVTIVRYDSTHGYLHRHRKISLTDKREVIDLNIKQGNHHEWLTIALTDLRTNYRDYRRLFFERSGVTDIYS